MNLDDIQPLFEKPKDNPLEGLSQEQIKALLEYRSEVLMDVSQAYKDFIETICKYPFHMIYRSHAFLNIDQGLHWIKAAVDNLWDIPKQEPIVELVESQNPIQEIV